MPIQSYFYDSVDNDRPYSGADFAKAFGMILTNGVIANDNGSLGLNLGSTGSTIEVREGRATIQGHFVEVNGTEIVSVPSGSYSGQLVLRVDIAGERRAMLVAKTDRNPTQDASMFEIPLYNLNVTNGSVTSTTDLRIQGGAIAKTAANVVTWESSATGVRQRTGLFSGDGKPVVVYYTANRPAASPTEHRVWIQIENF
jgi:hypothetical protein